MSITKLIVGGFRSIREETEIPIAPLTFLFGPNSAGKSAVLAAMDTLSEMLVPKAIEEGLVSRGVQLAIRRLAADSLAHQLPRQDTEVDDREEPSRTPVILGLEIDEFPIGKIGPEEPLDDAQRIAMHLYKQLDGSTVRLRFSGVGHHFVSSVAVDGEDLVEFIDAASFLNAQPDAVESPNLGLIADMLGINRMDKTAWDAVVLSTKHPFWRKGVLADKFSEVRRIETTATLSFIRQALIIDQDKVVIRTAADPLHANGWGTYTGKAHQSLMDIGLHGTAAESVESTKAREELLQAMLVVDLICASVSFLLDKVRSTAHKALKFARVPGDRKVLTRDDVTINLLLPTDGRSGPQLKDYAAWLGLLCAGDDLCAEDDTISEEVMAAVRAKDDLVNDTLQLDFFSGRGYQVKPAVWLVTNKNLLAEELSDIGGNFKHLDVSLYLEDANGRRLSFNEVGSGVSYVMPVLVSLWGAKRSWIEQPELHLHPEAQCEMGDVIIRAFNRGRFSIIETHSEHLLLRVLRRIRQTSKGPTHDPELRCLPEAVSILYFEPVLNGGTKVRPIRVSRSGDFMDRWPQGFFAERDRELFDE